MLSTGLHFALESTPVCRVAWVGVRLFFTSRVDDGRGRGGWAVKEATVFFSHFSSCVTSITDRNGAPVQAEVTILAPTKRLLGGFGSTTEKQ